MVFGFWWGGVLIAGKHTFWLQEFITLSYSDSNKQFFSFSKIYAIWLTGINNNNNKKEQICHKQIAWTSFVTMFLSTWKTRAWVTEEKRSQEAQIKHQITQQHFCSFNAVVIWPQSQNQVSLQVANLPVQGLVWNSTSWGSALPVLSLPGPLYLN